MRLEVPPGQGSQGHASRHRRSEAQPEGGGDRGAAEGQRRRDVHVSQVAAPAGTNCIQIGLHGKLILSKRKGLREILFS